MVSDKVRGPTWSGSTVVIHLSSTLLSQTEPDHAPATQGKTWTSAGAVPRASVTKSWVKVGGPALTPSRCPGSLLSSTSHQIAVASQLGACGRALICAPYSSGLVTVTWRAQCVI